MKVTPAQLLAWRAGYPGFLQWLEAFSPIMIPSSGGGWEPLRLTEQQHEFLRGALELREDGSGDFRYRTILCSMPRRHSKTICMALIVAWRFTLRLNEVILVVANSEKQTLSTNYRIIRDIFRHSPKLLALIGKRAIKRFSIDYAALGNEIRAVNCSASALHGIRTTCAWVTEIHAAPSTDTLDVLSGGLGDSRNSMLLIDSTCDPIGGDFHAMEQIAQNGEDPTMYSYRVEYASLEEALEKSPPWIDRDFLRAQARRMLPAKFAAFHLNKRMAAQNLLFSPEDMDRVVCEDLPARMEPGYLADLSGGRAWVCGGGLDRAASFSLHGDETVWCVAAKVAQEEGDAIFYVAAAEAIPFSFGKAIKKAVARDQGIFGLKNTVFEHYGAHDLSAWALEARIPNEIVFPSTNTQIPAFTHLAQIVREGRLRFSRGLAKLEQQMRRFPYEVKKSGNVTFGNERQKDDWIYALAWAVYALREQELHAYELPLIICNSSHHLAHECFLLAPQGDAILGCADECEGFHRVFSMWQRHKRERVDSELNLPEFYRNLVHCQGQICRYM
jgi:hypothetical protein